MTAKLLKREEEYELFSTLRKEKKGSAGWQKAYNRIAEANIGLVKFWANRLGGNDSHRDSKGAGFDDLFSHGCRGLIRAIDKFDHEKGCKFSTYASFWIRQTIQRGIQDDARTIRIPVHLQEKKRKMSKGIALLLQAGIPLTNKAIAQASSIKPKEVGDIKKAFFRYEHKMSIDIPIGTDESLSIICGLSNPEDSPKANEDLYPFIQALFDKAELTTEQREIAWLRLAEGKPYNEIAVSFGRSKQAIQQAMTGRILPKLTKAAKGKKLRRAVMEVLG